MNTPNRLFAFIPLLALYLVTSAARVTEDPVLPAQAKATDLAWLAGSWTGEGFGGQTDEHWAPSFGGTITGTFRLVSEDKLSMTLFFLIEEETDGLYLRFEHFGPGYIAWEKEPNVFKLEKYEANYAFFECPNDEQELRSIAYRISKEDELVVNVASRGEGTEMTEFELVFDRVSKK